MKVGVFRSRNGLKFMAPVRRFPENLLILLSERKEKYEDFD